MGRDELLRNEESRALRVELDATRCVRKEVESSTCRRDDKNHHLGSGAEARRGKRNHSMRLDTRTAGPLGDNPEQARRWNGGADQPKRNDNAWRVSIGERELIADDDAHHRVTERTNVQQGKRHEDEYSIHSRINAYTISSCRGVRL